MTSPGGGDLGTVRGKIVIDSSDAETSIDKAERKLTALEKRQQTAAKNLKEDATTAAKVYGTAVVVGFGLAVDAAKGFEQSLANVAAAGGKQAAQQMDAIRAKALQLGADTSFSSIEAANAMEVLIKAGLSVSDVLGGAADAAVALAAAEGVSIPEAAEIAAVAMTAFNLTADQMPAIANKISQAASATKMDMSDFSYAMNAAGAVSKLVGLSFDDMTLAITAMGKSGIVGSDAGTSLKTMLMNLQPGTVAQTALFKELGLVTEDGANKFFTAEGRIRSMTEIAGVLQDALSGMTQQQKFATLETLFGADAIRAAAIISEQGAQGMRNLTSEMESQLSVSDKAKVKQDTLSGAIEKMKGSIESAAIQVGTGFIPVIRDIAEFIEKAADAFSKLSPQTQQAIVWFLLGSTAALGMGFALAKIVTVVRDIWTVLRIGSLLKGTAEGMKVLGLAARITALQVRQAVVALGSWIAASARATAAMVADGAKATAAAVRTWAVMAAGWIRSAAVAMFNALIIAAAWIIANPWILIVAAVIALVAIIVTNWEYISSFLAGVWQWIKDTAATVWNAIKQFFIDWWPYILGIFTGGIGLLVAYVIDHWDEIKNWTVNTFTSIKQFFTDIWNSIISFLVGVALSIITTIRDGVSTAYTTIVDWMGRALRFFQDLPGQIVSFLSGLPGQLLAVGRNMMESLINGVKDVAGRIKDAVLGPIKDSVQAVKNFLGIASPAKLTYEIGADTGQGLINAMRDKAAEVRGAMTMMMNGGAPLTASASPLTSSAATVLGPAGSAGSILPTATGGTTNFYIDTVEVPIKASLDPTNAAQWRQAMGAIKQGIRDHDRSYR